MNARLYWWEKRTKKKDQGISVVSDVSKTFNKNLLKEITTLKSQLVYKENVIDSLNQQFATMSNSPTLSTNTLARSTFVQLQTDFDNDLRDLISVVSGLKTLTANIP